MNKLHVFEKEGQWYCISWPICGTGSTERAARVDYELRRLLYVPSSEVLKFKKNRKATLKKEK